MVLEIWQPFFPLIIFCKTSNGFYGIHAIFTEFSEKQGKNIPWLKILRETSTHIFYIIQVKHIFLGRKIFIFWIFSLIPFKRLFKTETLQKICMNLLGKSRWEKPLIHSKTRDKRWLTNSAKKKNHNKYSNKCLTTQIILF